ncbi:MAG: hypothetical protein AAF228_13360, partial [Pseudomonadota bacterium]
VAGLYALIPPQAKVLAAGIALARVFYNWDQALSANLEPNSQSAVEEALEQSYELSKTHPDAGAGSLDLKSADKGSEEIIKKINDAPDDAARQAALEETAKFLLGMKDQVKAPEILNKIGQNAAAGDPKSQELLPDLFRTIDNTNFSDPTYTGPTKWEVVDTMTGWFETQPAIVGAALPSGAGGTPPPPPGGGDGGTDDEPTVVEEAVQLVIPEVLWPILTDNPDIQTLILSYFSGGDLARFIRSIGISVPGGINTQHIEPLAGFLINLAQYQGTYQTVGGALGILYGSNPANPTLFTALLSGIATADLTAAQEATYSLTPEMIAPGNPAPEIYTAFEAQMALEAAAENAWLSYAENLTLHNPTLAYEILKEVAKAFGKDFSDYLDQLSTARKWKVLGALVGSQGDMDLFIKYSPQPIYENGIATDESLAALKNFYIGMGYTEAGARTAGFSMGMISGSLGNQLTEQVIAMLNDPSTSDSDIVAIARIVSTPVVSPRLNDDALIRLWRVATLPTDRFNRDFYLSQLYIVLKTRSPESRKRILKELAPQNPELVELLLDLMATDPDKTMGGEVPDIFGAIDNKLKLFASSSSLSRILLDYVTGLIDVERREFIRGLAKLNPPLASLLLAELYRRAVNPTPQPPAAMSQDDIVYAMGSMQVETLIEVFVILIKKGKSDLIKYYIDKNSNFLKSVLKANPPAYMLFLSVTGQIDKVKDKLTKGYNGGQPQPSFISLLVSLYNLVGNHSIAMPFLLSLTDTGFSLLPDMANQNTAAAIALMAELYKLPNIDITHISPTITDILGQTSGKIRESVLFYLAHHRLLESYINGLSDNARADFYRSLSFMKPSAVFKLLGKDKYVAFMEALDPESLVPYFEYLIFNNATQEKEIALYNFYQKQTAADLATSLSYTKVKSILKFLSNILYPPTLLTKPSVVINKLSQILQDLGPHISRRVLSPPGSNIEIAIFPALPSDFPYAADGSDYGLAQGASINVPDNGTRNPVVLFSAYDFSYSVIALPDPTGAITEIGHPAATLALLNHTTGDITEISSEPIGLGATLSINDHGALIYSSDSGAMSETILPGSDTPTSNAVFTIIEGEAVLYDPAKGRIWDSSKGPYTPPDG